MSFYIKVPKNIPKIVWQYWGLIEFMLKHPGLYGMDDRRIKAHNELCKEFGLSKEETKVVTDNLDKYDNAVDLYYALMELKNNKED